MSEFRVDADNLNSMNLAIIAKKGLVYPSDKDITNIPDEDKMFPTDISELTVEELLNKQAVFTALYASASVNEALAMTEVASYERELEIKKGQVMALSNSSKVTDKRQEALIDEAVIKLQENLTVAESKLKFLSALKNSYDLYIKLFSRGLTSKLEEHKLQ
jgi:hypothetical protein